MNYGLSDCMVIEILVSAEIYTSVDKYVHTTKYRVHLAMIGFKLAALVGKITDCIWRYHTITTMIIIINGIWATYWKYRPKLHTCIQQQ